MKKREDIQYFLSLERRPKDVKFINIANLHIANGYNPHNLKEIDSFTMYFTKEEIIDAIKEDNIVETEYQNGNLVIQDALKKYHPLVVIDKEFWHNFNLLNFLKEKLDNKEFINNVAYKLKNIMEKWQMDSMSIIENVNYFKKGMQENNVNAALNTILALDYNMQREFIVYLLNIYHKELNNIPKVERTRDKVA